MAGHAEPESLRGRVLRSGSYLTIRRATSILFSLIVALLLTRILGPSIYGLYAAAFSVYSFLVSIGLMGINIYLIRETRSASERLFDLAFWWLLGVGGGLFVGAVGIFSVLGHFWIRTEGFLAVSIFLCLSLPIVLVNYVPLALLEREFKYREIVIIEIFSQTINYCIAIPMAWLGYGVWSLVAGFWLSQTTTVAGVLIATRYRPRWYWSRADLKPMLRYGFSQAASGWLYDLRKLAPTLFLLPYAGETAVGYLTLANRFLSMLSFSYEAAGRLSIPAFARLRQDMCRLARAITEAMQLQTLALGISLAGFALVSPFVFPLLLGNRWDANLLLMVFAIGGIRMLLSALFAIQGSALFVIGKNWLMFKANLAYILMLFPLTYLGVHFAPPEYRLFVFNIADLLSHIPTYLYKHYGVAKFVGHVDYKVNTLWTVSMLAALIAPWLGWWLYGITLLGIVNPYSLKRLAYFAHWLKNYRKMNNKQRD